MCHDLYVCIIKIRSLICTINKAIFDAPIPQLLRSLAQGLAKRCPNRQYPIDYILLKRPAGAWGLFGACDLHVQTHVGWLSVYDLTPHSQFHPHPSAMVEEQSAVFPLMHAFAILSSPLPETQPST